jgi:DNA-binding CsgD family transcriptional regulator
MDSATLVRHDPSWPLAAAARIAACPLPELLGVFAALVDELLPGGRRERLVAMLTGDCSRAPLKVRGGGALPAPVTSAQLARLAAAVEVGAASVRRTSLGGVELPALVVATAPAGLVGSLFAIELDDDMPEPETVALLHGLCELVALAYADRATDQAPGMLVESLAAAQERARTIVEPGEAHEAALTAVLAALRARDLGDGAARAAATDIAVAALIELRDAGERDRALSEEPAAGAFARLREQLRPIGRYASAALELDGPGEDRSLPADLAHAARAISRGIALVMLEQEGIGRIRIDWEVVGDELRLRARDDGPGALSADALAVHRTAERVAALGGRLEVDAVAGWGTTVTVALPLAPLERIERNPLATLNARELEVLGELTRGRRNREIGETLSITPHTVKFHVGNILRKLGAASRGEAAALAREHGFSAAPRA